MPLLKFNFQVTSGSTTEFDKSYGILIAQSLGFPQELIRDATQIAKLLRAGANIFVPDFEQLKVVALHALLGRLFALRNTKLPTGQVRTLLMDMVHAFADDIARAKQRVQQQQQQRQGPGQAEEPHHGRQVSADEEDH
jgi:DNA mismatch repair ATPase MutS